MSEFQLDGPLYIQYSRMSLSTEQVYGFFGHGLDKQHSSYVVALIL